MLIDYTNDRMIVQFFIHLNRAKWHVSIGFGVNAAVRSRTPHLLVFLGQGRAQDFATGGSEGVPDEKVIFIYTLIIGSFENTRFC